MSDCGSNSSENGNDATGDSSDSRTTARDDVPPRLSPSVALDLLSSRRRRLLLSILQTSDRDVFEFGSLVDELVTREAEMGVDGEPAARSVETSLVHVHLPRLDDANLVEYDLVDGTVGYRSDETVATYLEYSGELE